MGRAKHGYGREYISLADLKNVKNTEELIGIFGAARFKDEAEANICEGIFPDSSLFLKGNETRQFIRRDIDDLELANIIAERKNLILRIYPYFESIISLFYFSKNEDLSGFIEHLEDVLTDLPHITRGNRKDRARRELKNKISDVRIAATKIKNAMSKAEVDLKTDFDSSYTCYARLILAQERGRRDWHDLLFDIEYLDVLAELELLKIDQDAEHTQHLGNSGKAHIVNAAHWMSAGRVHSL